MYIRLWVKSVSLKKSLMTVSVRVSFGYTREVWRTRAREVRVTVALVHGRKLLYAFQCWEKTFISPVDESLDFSVCVGMALISSDFKL